MWNAVVVDRDYGSVNLESQQQIQREYADNGINLSLNHCITPQEIIDACQDADVILATGNPPITREVLEALPRLKIVQRFGIGVNSVDLDAATENGILILYMPGFCVQELATHAAALILDLLRNVSFYDRGIRKGEWRKAGGPLPRSPENLTLGLFGFGASAKPLYDIFYNGFGTKIITFDPYISEEAKEEYQIEVVDFDELLMRSDIVSIHAPLTPETYHIFNKDAFQKMKNDAMIVNISRGELIAQSDLIEALEQGEIQFAGLDVFEKEPLPMESPLIDNEYAVLTCHSAFYGDMAQKQQLSLAVDLVDAALNQGVVDVTYIANKGVVSKIRDLAIKG